MNREEQIKWLRKLLKLREDPKGDTEIDVALKCAIKALESESSMGYVQEAVNTIMNTCNTDSITDKAMRNAARFVQNAIDGSYPDFEELPKMGKCKDCKYFEYDSVAEINGIPLIVAHEICSRWGNGCGTKEDGYCFLFEPQAEGSDKE